MFDVDIDVSPVTDRSVYGTRAMVYNEEEGKILPHPSGIYLNNVPIDEMTGLSAFDYKYGDAHGYMKVDLLNNSVYREFKSKQDIIDVMNQPVEWGQFRKRAVVEALPHLGKHYELVNKVSPSSIIELADVIALIRPGKDHLIVPYLEDRVRTRKNLYRQPKTGVYFKKSHAIGYAVMIVCALSTMRTRHGIVWQH